MKRHVAGLLLGSFLEFLVGGLASLIPGAKPKSPDELVLTLIMSFVLFFVMFCSKKGRYTPILAGAVFTNFVTVTLWRMGVPTWTDFILAGICASGFIRFSRFLSVKVEEK